MKIPFQRHQASMMERALDTAKSRIGGVRTRIVSVTPAARRAQQERARRRQRAIRFAGLGAAAAAVGGLAKLLASPERRARITGTARSIPGRARGLGYRALRRHPEDNVPDQVLADRVRSTLGPLEKKLDVPHVHVSVCDGVVSLHGSVGSEEAASAITAATERIHGVRSVEGRLRPAISPTDTRPSDGKRRSQEIVLN